MRYLFLASLFLMLVACGEDPDQYTSRIANYQSMCQDAVEAGWGASDIIDPQQTCVDKMDEVYRIIVDDAHPCIHGSLPRICWINSHNRKLSIWGDLHSHNVVPAEDIHKVIPHLQWFGDWLEMEIHSMSGAMDDSSGIDDDHKTQPSMSDLRRLTIVDGEEKKFEYFYLAQDESALIDAIHCLGDPSLGYPDVPTYNGPVAPITYISVASPKIYGEYWTTEFTVSKFGAPAKQVLWSVVWNGADQPD